MAEDTAGFNPASLPADIQAWIAGEVAKAVSAATTPAVPRELSPEEKLHAAVDRCARELSGEHEPLIAALRAIVSHITGGA